MMARSEPVSVLIPTVEPTSAVDGIRRWTFLLAVPSIVASLPLLVYALLRETFVWGGRRYRWPDRFDVEVLD